MGVPLVWDSKELAAYRQRIENQKIPLHEMKRIVSGDATIVGDRPSHVFNFPLGYRLVYSIEEHPLRNGSGTIWIRHMSMSIAVEGRAPNPIALEMIGKELGFPPLKECSIQMEGSAVCVLAEYKE